MIDGQPDRRAIEALAAAELRGSAYHALRRVTCRLQDGVLTLCGRVPTFFLKQVAQSLLMRRLGGAVVINNCLDVDSHEKRRGANAGAPQVAAPHLNGSKMEDQPCSS